MTPLAICLHLWKKAHVFGGESFLVSSEFFAMFTRYSVPILAVAVSGSFYLIYHVHRQQELDRARLHEGVIRDQERQRYKLMKLQESEQSEVKQDSSS